MKLSVATKKKDPKNYEKEKKPGAMGHEALYGTSRKGRPKVA
jgi:hypothetical protein